MKGVDAAGLAAQMHYQNQVVEWLQADAMRMSALRVAASLNLDDWCIAAGFVRNMIWDKLHGYTEATPLNDIDLIYFDDTCISEVTDLGIERQLKLNSPLPWSVKNQARMYLRNKDQPYASLSDAMSYWIEIETAIGARLTSRGEIELIMPWGLRPLFANTVTLNAKRKKLDAFERRLASKRWLQIWPNLVPIIQ